MEFRLYLCLTLGNLSPPYFLTPCARPYLPRFIKLKPLVTFLVLAYVFLMDLVLATRTGLHVYHLLYTYLATWPCLMILLLTLISATWSHGTRHVMRDLADLSKVTLPHWVTSHLSVIYTTVAPRLSGLMTAGINMILSNKQKLFINLHWKMFINSCFLRSIKCL